MLGLLAFGSACTGTGTAVAPWIGEDDRRLESPAAAELIPARIRRLSNAEFAQSMGGTLPLKFIGVYQQHGIAAEYYTMRATDTETVFDLGYDNFSVRSTAR